MKILVCTNCLIDASNKSKIVTEYQKDVKTNFILMWYKGLREWLKNRVNELK